jgi:zinc protease
MLVRKRFLLSAGLFCLLLISSTVSAEEAYNDTAWPGSFIPGDDDARFPGLPGHVEILTLDNGLQVLLLPNPAQDMVSVVTQVKVGSAFEDFRTSGMSHMLEHLLFNGSEKYTQEVQYDMADQAGIWNNAHTSDFFTNYIVIQPAANLETGLDLQSQMLFHSTLPQEKFEKEQGIVVGELVQAMDDASNYADTVLRNSLYKDSSLALPTLGTLSTIQNMNRDDVYAFYRNHYVPNNMITTIAGNFQRDEALELLGQYYGVIPPGSVERPRIKPAPYIEQTTTVTRRGGDRDMLMMAFEAPGYGSPDFFPFLILSSMLEADTGVLQQALDALPAEEIPELSVWWQSAEGYARLVIELGLPTDADPARYHNLVESALARFAEWGVTTADVERIVNSQATEVLIEREQLRHLAIMSAEQIAQGGVDFFINYLDQMSAVRAEDVTRVISAYLVDSPHLNLHILSQADDSETTADAAGVEMTRSVLENGMTLITLRNPVTPLYVAHLTVRDRALIDGETPGALNLVHRLLAHGSGGCDKACLDERLQSLGVVLKLFDDPRFPMDNYYTNGHFSYVRLEAAAENGTEALSILLEQIQHASFTTEAADEERQAQSMLLARSANSARAKAAALMADALYGDHALSGPPEGRAGRLEEIDYDLLRQIYRRAFTPSNLIMTIVSPQQHQTIARQIETQLSGRGDLELELQPIPLTTEPQRVTDSLGGRMASIRLGSNFRINPDDQTALELLVAVLSNRQAMDLRETRGLSYSVGSAISIHGNEASFGSWINPPLPRTAEAEAALQTSINEFNGLAITQQELDKARGARRGRLMMRRLSSIAQAYYLAMYEMNDDPSGYLDCFARMDAVTLADLARVHDAYMAGLPMVTVVVD